MQFDSSAQVSSSHSPAGSSRGSEASAADNADRLFLQQAEKTRADTYRILARLFRAAPDSDLIRHLSDCVASSGEDASDSKLGLAWTELARASQDADPAELDHEFHGLFIGLGRGEVLPYASWYVSGFLLDKPLARLRADLERLGIGRADKVSESEDHVAALCETMALLVDPDGGVDLATQKQFFDNHLQPWVGRLLADVQRAQSADFYRPVARLGEAFIEFEHRWLSLPQ